MGGCMSEKASITQLSNRSQAYQCTTQPNNQNDTSCHQTNTTSSSSHCRVSACAQTHQRHYCRVCQEKDSDHFARDCPESIVAYHGTSSNVLDVIKAEGFKPSQTGNLGKGVYFTDDQVVAQQISQHRAGHRNAKPVVFQCRIPKNLEVTQERNHGVWHNVTENSFKEFSVKDPKRIKLLGVQEL